MSASRASSSRSAPPTFATSSSGGDVPLPLRLPSPSLSCCSPGTRDEQENVVCSTSAMAKPPAKPKKWGQKSWGTTLQMSRCSRSTLRRERKEGVFVRNDPVNSYVRIVSVFRRAVVRSLRWSVVRRKRRRTSVHHFPRSPNKLPSFLVPKRSSPNYVLLPNMSILPTILDGLSRPNIMALIFSSTSCALSTTPGTSCVHNSEQLRSSYPGDQRFFWTPSCYLQSFRSESCSKTRTTTTSSPAFRYYYLVRQNKRGNLLRSFGGPLAAFLHLFVLFFVRGTEAVPPVSCDRPSWSRAGPGGTTETCGSWAGKMCGDATSNPEYSAEHLAEVVENCFDTCCARSAFPSWWSLHGGKQVFHPTNSTLNTGSSVSCNSPGICPVAHCGLAGKCGKFGEANVDPATGYSKCTFDESATALYHCDGACRTPFYKVGVDGSTGLPTCVRDFATQYRPSTAASFIQARAAYSLGREWPIQKRLSESTQNFCRPGFSPCRIFSPLSH